MLQLFGFELEWYGTEMDAVRELSRCGSLAALCDRARPGSVAFVAAAQDKAPLHELAGARGALTVDPFGRLAVRRREPMDEAELGRYLALDEARLAGEAPRELTAEVAGRFGLVPATFDAYVIASPRAQAELGEAAGTCHVVETDPRLCEVRSWDWRTCGTTRPGR